MFCKYIPLYLKILGVVNIFLLHLRNVPMYLNANYLYTVKKNKKYYISPSSQKNKNLYINALII